MNEVARKVITIDPDFAAIWGDLDDEAYGRLKHEIKADGIRDPLVIWNPNNEYILVDGHNRLRIAKELNMMAVPVSYKVFKDKAEAAAWIVNHQSARRNLTDWQKYMAMKMFQKILKEQAKMDGHQGGRPAKKPLENSPEVFEPINTRKETAKASGLSEWKIRQGDFVRDYASEEQKAALDSGKKDLKEVYQETIRANTMKKIADQARDEHEEFLNQKSVTVEDIRRDKINQHILQNDAGHKTRAELHRAASVFSTFNYLKSESDYQNFIRYEGSDLPNIIRELMDARNSLDTIISNLIEKGKKFGKDDRL